MHSNFMHSKKLFAPMLKLESRNVENTFRSEQMVAILKIISRFVIIGIDQSINKNVN